MVRPAQLPTYQSQLPFATRHTPGTRRDSRQRRRELKGHPVRQAIRLPRITDRILRKSAVPPDAQVAIVVRAVVAILLGAAARAALYAAVGLQAAHDAVADGEIGDCGADADDGAGALVGAGDRQARMEGALGDHAVGVAEGGDGDFDDEVGGVKGGRGGGGDRVDAVGLVDWLWVSVWKAVCDVRGRDVHSITWAASIVLGREGVAIVKTSLQRYSIGMQIL